MVSHLSPDSPRALADLLASFSSQGTTLQTGGAFSKNRLGAPVIPAQCVVSTARLDRVLQYEPKDLTISVEAGMPWAGFTTLLAGNRQMVPLDPPFADVATVGGVIVSNICGPRRRWFGSARDAVIGMQYATLDGKLVQSGGMVVKNVAGLDTGKLMIGSYGTLGVVTSVNFKLTPVPPVTRTFLFYAPVAKAVFDKRDWILRGVLQPWAIDLLNPHASARLGHEGWLLAVQAGGSGRVIERYSTELSGAVPLEGDGEAAFWESVREFTPGFLASKPAGVVVRLSTRLSGLATAVEHAPVPVVARAGNGVAYTYFAESDGAHQWLAAAAAKGYRGTIEFHGSGTGGTDLWPAPGGELDVMLRIKRMFDPNHLLNRGRLHGRI
jgi:glycolate oxidase FAD binding subunit